MPLTLNLWLFAFLALGYLLGSIPFGLLVTRAAGLGDVRKIGSGNIGATNVLRTGNKKLAAATLFLDGFKGLVAVVLAQVMAPAVVGPPAISGGFDASALLHQLSFILSAPWIAALGAVIGHVYPVWLGFSGGKGVATYIGALIGVAWPAAAVFAVVWLVMAAIFRISSLASLTAILAVLVFVALEPNPVVITAVGLMSLLIVYKHKANIERLLKGEEPRIGVKG